MNNLNLKDIATAKKLKKPPKLRPIQEPRAVERQYLKLLKQLTNELKNDVRKNIIPLLKTSTITNDSVDDILTALAGLSAKFSNINSFANSTTDIVVNGIEKSNRDRFFKSINNSIGVDLKDIVREEGLTDLVALQKSKNVALIKSIPSEFIKEIEVIVQNGLADGMRHEAIAKQISGVKGIKSTFGKLENRIKMIARNEVASINGSLSKARQENLGVTMYTFETSRDERVRPSHQVMQGKICKWDDATVYKNNIDDKKWLKRSSIGGVEKHPAMDFNCRCVSLAIIE
ncbi:MAG: minor capsid protein [Campylobacterota bacterium]|nr:minor capsid protein [Campylobacterota bacterium]